ncbi:DNA repair protein RecN [Iodidimonas sp. SYSU 1G8]|uniref:DNA repair protein RecN n=1 Tax=Iodidimonas sp. SYSU 1G8 TaxID=3133967 RepID=UPI0031FF43C9
MLTALSIQNIVLIDRLALEFRPGLSVLTGETGAGKSILLDSLGLVSGARADSGLVRTGSSGGTVTAEFDIPSTHPVYAVLAEQGLDAGGGPILLRRQLTPDGRSRAFVNDQPVGVALLSRVGGLLVEIHGQQGQLGLLNPANHRALLDSFGGLTPQVSGMQAAYKIYRDLSAEAEAARARLAKARTDEDYLRHAAEELAALNPRPGEEEELADTRTAMMHGEQIAGELDDAMKSISGDKGAEPSLRVGMRRLERVADKASGRLDPIIEGLNRAFTEIEEASRALEAVARDLEFDPRVLEHTEERLFALRAAARKHNCTVEDLPAMREAMMAQIQALDTGEQGLVDLERRLREAEAEFATLAEGLSAARGEAAARLDAAVMAELPPLKLERAVFHTAVNRLPRDKWSAAGADDVQFEVATNPGSAMGPLSRIASGGELSRFALALKVVLAESDHPVTLIFDEIDQGVGGAVAAAVGARLARLSDRAQVLVVTHSPQVAARGGQHLRVGKIVEEGVTLTRVEILPPDERREEIARMLAGAQVTDEARAAATRLLEGVEA